MTESQHTLLRIGLTGGIASGKSIVADMFTARSVPVIDTDLISRKVVEPGQPGLREVTREFGAEFLRTDGTLDRARLRRKIFSDAHARDRLETILHPLIRKATFSYARDAGGPYQVFAVPLLAETGFGDLVDRILVIDCPPETQRQRLIARDGETEKSADTIIRTQASREQRLAIADDIIVNAGTLEDLERSVEALHQRYLTMSAAPEPSH